MKLHCSYCRTDAAPSGITPKYAVPPELEEFSVYEMHALVPPCAPYNLRRSTHGRNSKGHEADARKRRARGSMIVSPKEKERKPNGAFVIGH